MPRPWNRDWALLGISLAACLWSTWPPEQIAFDRACRPAGVQAEISAVLHGRGFWRRQMLALQTDRDRLVGQMARSDDDSHADIGSVSEIEARMNRLAESKANPDDPDQRERQEAALQHRRLDRLAWLNTCEIQIRHRLGQ